MMMSALAALNLVILFQYVAHNFDFVEVQHWSGVPH